MGQKTREPEFAALRKITCPVLGAAIAALQRALGHIFSRRAGYRHFGSPRGAFPRLVRSSWVLILCGREVLAARTIECAPHGALGLRLLGRPSGAARTPGSTRSRHRRCYDGWEAQVGAPASGCTRLLVHVGLLAFKNARKWRTANGTRALASFQGKNVICAFGASMAVSSATA